MTWLESVILGLLQGVTEFLPVSSSGHLELGIALLGVETDENLLFAIVVHLATAMATVVVFRKEIFSIVNDLFSFKWNKSTQFFGLILISTLPVFVVGVFFKDEIESLFVGNLLLVGAMLIVTSILLFFAHKKKSENKSISTTEAVIIGIAQALAIAPGISRSGATISTALILGVDRSEATKFSFLMVLIPILGASALQFLEYFQSPHIHHMQPKSLVIGFVAAFISGFISCRWMLKIIRKGKLKYFAIYCFLIGFIAIISHH